MHDEEVQGRETRGQDQEAQDAANQTECNVMWLCSTEALKFLTGTWALFWEHGFN